jgi:hypothetical protein
MVGALYASFIYPMMMDYLHPDTGLIANHLTQKERSSRIQAEQYMKYMPGEHKLKELSQEKKRKNLRKFFCRPCSSAPKSLFVLRSSAPKTKKNKKKESRVENNVEEFKKNE